MVRESTAGLNVEPRECAEDSTKNINPLDKMNKMMTNIIYSDVHIPSLNIHVVTAILKLKKL